MTRSPIIKGDKAGAPGAPVFAFSTRAPKTGLDLRPPRDILRIIHLIREHSSAVAYRPISFGNTKFLEGRIKDLRCLKNELHDRISRLQPAWRSFARQLERRLEFVSEQQPKRFFASIVSLCDRNNYLKFWEKTSSYVPASRSPLLQKKYRRMLVITGPGIGLGDEITCFSLIQALRKTFPDARFDFFGYYEGLWTILGTDFKFHCIADHPLAPFDCVDQLIRRGWASDALVLYINFGGLKFHLGFGSERRRPDIVEIAVGAGVAWYTTGNASVVHVVSEMDPIYPGNYRTMGRLADRLVGNVGQTQDRPKSISRQRTPGKTYRIIVNPFTSKPMILTPRDWVMLLRDALGRLPRRKPTDCVVFPGISEDSLTYAKAIVTVAAGNPCKGLKVRLLEPCPPITVALPFDGKRLDDGVFLESATPSTRLSPSTKTNCSHSHQEQSDEDDSKPFLCYLHDVMEKADLLVGIDTFSSHLAAWTRTPAVNLCYERNIQFWPDEPSSAWIELERDLSLISELTALWMALSGSLPEPELKRFMHRLPVDEMQRLEAFLSDANHGEGCSRMQQFVYYTDSVWNGLPLDTRFLLEHLDANYAWPRIRSWVTQKRLDTNQVAWLYDLASRSHLRRVCAMVARLNTWLQNHSRGFES